MHYRIEVRKGKLGTGRRVLEERHEDSASSKKLNARVRQLQAQHPDSRVRIIHAYDSGPSQFMREVLDL